MDERVGQVRFVADTDVGDRGVGGDQQPDLFGVVGERRRGAGLQVERAEVVAFDVQLQRQHARRARFCGAGGEQWPPLFGAEVW